MTHLTDEQAIAKANSMDWFDNQAGVVDFLKPKKKLITIKPKGNNNDLSLMTVAQLQDQYVLAIEQLDVMKDVPKNLREFVNQKATKIYSYMLAIRIELRKKQTKGDSLILDEVLKLKSMLDENKLNQRISMLENELSQARESKVGEKAAKKAERIERANTREIMIHIKFKGLVKEYIGDDKYMTLIREADVLADAELSKG